jgi:hypothetical protein
MEPNPQELFDDQGLPGRLPAPAERNLAQTLAFEARDIALGGLEMLRRHPVGSLEVGGALAATGIAVGALIVPRLRHAH